MVLTSIKEAFKEAKNKSWKVIYIWIDIHKTIIEPDYTNKLETVIYPYAKEAIQLMSKMPFIELGLYTCSHPEEIEKYQKLFRSHGMIFQHVNKNDNVKNTTYGNFSEKPYYNTLIDDKSSFRPKEWKGLYEYFKNLQYKLDGYNSQKELLAHEIYKIDKSKEIIHFKY